MPVPRLLMALSLTSLLLTGAIFGFFYAWVCSTMWGLDQIDPRVSLTAMNGMNASVRNAVFAPAFFATPFASLLAGLVAWKYRFHRSALWFVAAGLIYLCGGLLLTMTLNVPMNEALALRQVPSDILAAQEIWQDYSGPWQQYNLIRTVLSGLSLLCVGCGLLSLTQKA